MKINYKSDFDFLLRLETADGVTAGWPSHDWRALFRTSDPSRVFEASCIGGVCVNCREDDGRIHIVADGHGLGPGQLWCEYEEMIPDAGYPDGTRREVTPCRLDIQLVPGASDAGPAIGVVPLPGGGTTDVSALLDELAAMRSTVAAMEKRLESIGAGGGGGTAEDPSAPPRAFIDMWNTACGSWGRYNASTGFFELNGLTDITYEQALEIYRISARPFCDLAYSYSDFRTNIFPYQNNLNGSTLWGAGGDEPNNAGSLFKGCTAEVIRLAANNTRICYISYAKAFYDCRKLRRIIGVVRNFIGSGKETDFYNCVSLEEVFIRICKSVNMKDSPLISYDSLRYLVDNNNNGTTAVTVTVHANVYAKLTGDTTNAAAAKLTQEELEQWRAILTQAAAKNITFTTPAQVSVPGELPGEILLSDYAPEDRCQGA